ERPAKAAGRSARFKAQGLRSETSPKKWAFYFLALRAGTRSTGLGPERKPKPSRTEESCAGGLWSADFFGASPVASALGIRSGATPCGQSIATTADGNDRWPARSSPAGKLR